MTDHHYRSEVEVFKQLVYVLCHQRVIVLITVEG
ncbi:Uncharacterised protein [Vibrio cholerae]|nr:Uncharacterised protein [Vibrio cholerae]